MIINKTPHNVNIVSNGMETIVIPKSETPIRVSATREVVETRYGILIFQTKLGSLENMPPKIEKDDIYIVSRICKTKILEEYPKEFANQFLVPEGIVRDEKGNIIGCEGLAY